MPKELTHIVLAQAVCRRMEQLDVSPSFSAVLKENRDYLLFGAIMHDVAFCSPSGAAGDIVKAMGMTVHGKPTGNTMRPLCTLANEFDRTGNTSVLALLAGAVTHMIVDRVFHPFVYYYTGNDISRHYRIETLIDVYFFKWKRKQLPESAGTSGIYRHLYAEREQLAVHLCRFLGLPQRHIPILKKAMKMHRFVLKLFRSRLGYYLFAAVSRLGSDDLKSKIHLFYPAEMTYEIPFFEDSFFYRHPVTGEETTEKMEDIIERVIDFSTEILAKMVTSANERKLESLFLSMPSLSLETGLDASVPGPFHFTDVSLSINQLVSYSSGYNPEKSGDK